MKKSIIFLIIILVAIGCETYITEDPIDFLSPESLTSVEGAEATVKAAYEPIQASYNQIWFSFQEFQSDYVISRGSRLPVSVYNIDVTNIGRIDGIWGDFYRAINIANTIIASFPDLDFSDNLEGQWIAEAKVIRALMYFNLIRGWRHVPLRIVPIDDLNNTAIPISGEAEVYDQIIKDLSEAINSGYLPEEYSADELGRASVYAARVLLAHVYLTTGNWIEAANMAQQVINSGKFQLEPDMYKIFSPENISHSGYIWSLKFARIDGLGLGIPNWLHGKGTNYSARQNYTYIGIPEHLLLANWDDKDKRKQLNLYNTDKSTIEGKSLSAAVPMLFKKYIDSQPAGTDHGNDLPLYRYADALLIFAEADCQAKNGPGVEAYEAINKVRRRGYGVDINTPNPEFDLNGLSQDEFIDAVWQERFYEFMMEGKRWFDLKRMGYAKATQQIQSSGDARKIEFWGQEDWFWPIPRQEIDNNDLITDADQNPGY